MKNLLVSSVCSILTFLSTTSLSQEEKSIATELELGAIFTSGNTEDENIKYGLTIDWDHGDWDYRFSSDGFRSSRQNNLTGQRLYHVANADYTFDEAGFIKTRLAYEDDRFSGFESQSDFTVNYGRKLLLNRDDMNLELNFGAGVRRSETETNTENVAITRFEGSYEWNLSETAKLLQDFSIDSGSDSRIYRSESAIQSNILDNLSMKFSVKIKHQTDVPVGREKTDTQTAITLVLDF